MNQVMTDIWPFIVPAILAAIGWQFRESYLLKTKVGVQTDPAAYTFCIIQQDGNGRLYNLLMS